MTDMNGQSRTEKYSVERVSQDNDKAMTLAAVRQFVHETSHLPGELNVSVTDYKIAFGLSSYSGTLSVTRKLPMKGGVA
ncbi:hypothetical protein RCF19_29960 [Rhodococcus qingshengii]